MRPELEYRAEHPDEVAHEHRHQARRQKREHRAYCLEQGFDVNAPTPNGCWADAVLAAESDAEIIALPPRHDFHWERATVPGYVEELAAVTARYEAWRAALAEELAADDGFERAVGTDAVLAAAVIRDDTNVVLSAAAAAHGADEGWQGRFDDAVAAMEITLLEQELEDYLGVAKPEVWADFIDYFGREPMGPVERDIAADPSKFDRWAELVGTAAQPKISAADTSEHEAAVAVEMARQRAREDAADRLRNEKAQREAVPLVRHSLQDVLNQPDIEFHVDQILPKGTVGVFAGAPGMGKSAILLEMMARSMTGQQVFAEFDTTPANWLIVAGEGVTGYGPRIRALQFAHDIQIPDEWFELISEGVDLMNSVSIDRLADVATERKIDVVVLDTLSQLANLDSEDNAAEMKRAIKAARRLCKANPGLTVIIIHHTVKSAEKVRGSGAIRGNTDWTWMLKGNPDALKMSNYLEDDGKAKDFAPLRIHGLSLQSAFGSVVVERAHGPNLPPSATRGHLILPKLKQGQTYSTADLHSFMKNATPGIADITIRRDIKALVDAGTILKIGVGKYRVPMSGAHERE